MVRVNGRERAEKVAAATVAAGLVWGVFAMAAGPGAASAFFGLAALAWLVRLMLPHLFPGGAERARDSVAGRAWAWLTSRMSATPPLSGAEGADDGAAGESRFIITPIGGDGSGYVVRPRNPDRKEES